MPFSALSTEFVSMCSIATSSTPDGTAAACVCIMHSHTGRSGAAVLAAATAAVHDAATGQAAQVVVGNAAAALRLLLILLLG